MATSVSNKTVAVLLTEIARLLEVEGANPFRVSAYRRAATMIGRLRRPLADVFADQGVAGLERLPGVGDSLAHKIAAILRHGFSPSLERLRQRHKRLDLFTTLPTVGPRLAKRIRAALGIDSLEELLVAAGDGRLGRLPGIGRKRALAIRESLAARLDRPVPVFPPTKSANQPPVADLLALDREYRNQAARGGLLTTAPRAFNPTGAAWLPIFRAKRGGRSSRFTTVTRPPATGSVICVIGSRSAVRTSHGRASGRSSPRGMVRFASSGSYGAARASVSDIMPWPLRCSCSCRSAAKSSPHPGLSS